MLKDTPFMVHVACINAGLPGASGASGQGGISSNKKCGDEGPAAVAAATVTVTATSPTAHLIAKRFLHRWKLLVFFELRGVSLKIIGRVGF